MTALRQRKAKVQTARFLRGKAWRDGEIRVTWMFVWLSRLFAVYKLSPSICLPSMLPLY